MLGLLLLYWIGKYFYKLAEEYHKNLWGFAILGVVVYYGGIFFFGIIAVVMMEIIYPGSIDTFNETLLSLLMIPFGILSSYLLYKYLEKVWKKNRDNTNKLIDEIGR